MIRLFALILLMTLLLPLAAQEATPPDYRVQALGYEVAADVVTVNFGVTNIGGAASERASAVLIDLADGREVARADDVVPILQGNGDTIADLSISFPVQTFPPGNNVALQIAVGVDEVETADSLTIFNNYDGISVQIPFYQVPPTTPPPIATPPGIPAQTGENIIEVAGVAIDLNDSRDLAIVGGILLSGAGILLLLVLIIRVLFRRTPKFGTWQPPYATMPALDPNSTYGRRQAWQPHAQNNILPNPCQPGGVHPRKLLLGMEGDYLAGWRIKALRLTQYDMYGRVARSQVLANGDMIARLQRVARRMHKLDAAKISRRVRPVARGLAGQLRRRINRRSAMLPIALDVRFQGTHGEVRIVFELYDCPQGQPVKLDTWEPEMTVVGRRIYESYTYSLPGQAGGEAYRDFRRRLPDDLTEALVAMLRPVSLPQPAPVSVEENTRPIKVEQKSQDSA